MSTASSRALMRLLTVAFLLLLPSDRIERADISAHRHHSSHPSVAAANHLLAAAPVGDVDTAPLQLLTCEASLLDRRVQSAPAPSRDALSLCAYERTTDQAARPPPLQA